MVETSAPNGVFGPEGVRGYRVVRELRLGGKASGFVVTARDARRGQGRFVLRWISSDEAEGLRPDLADLISYRHGSLGLPDDAERLEDGSVQVLRRFVNGLPASVLRSTGPSESKWLRWISASVDGVAQLHRAGFYHGAIDGRSLVVPWSGGRRGSVAARVVLCDPRLERVDFDCLETVVQRDLVSLGRAWLELCAGEAPESATGFSRQLSGLSVHLTRLFTRWLDPDSSGYESADEILADLARVTDDRSAAASLPVAFFGRDDERRTIATELAKQHGGVIALTSRVGEGRTAFLRRVEVEARLAGKTVVFQAFHTASVEAGPYPLLRRFVPAGDEGRSSRRRLRELEASPPDGSGVWAAEAAASQRTGAYVDFANRVLAARRVCVLLDDVQFADESTLDFLGEWIRRSAGVDRRGSGLTIVCSWGDDASFHQRVEPLRRVLQGKGARFVSLVALEPKAVSRWIGLAGSKREELARQLETLPESERGHAATVEAMLLRSLTGEGTPPPEATASSALADCHRALAESLSSDARSVVEVLALLKRPASKRLLSLATSRTASALHGTLLGLEEEGIVASGEDGVALRSRSFARWLDETMLEDDRKTLHRTIAELGRDHGVLRRDEIAQHALDGTGARDAAPEIRAVARELVRGRQVLRALDLYARLEDLCAGDASLLEERAEAYARSGRYAQAAKLLGQRVAGFPADSSSLERGRLRTRLGISLHRAGDVAKGEIELDKARAELAEADDIDSRRESLWAQSELAEIASNRGEYERAEAICRSALEELRTSEARDAIDFRRVEMILLETLGHGKLRRFDYPAAEELFAASLEISREIEATSDRSLILNNLGILYNQTHRYREAMACYEEAAEVSRRLGDEIVLVNIESNLAMLAAKRGDLRAADRALEAAAGFEANCDSSRTRFMRLHCVGIVESLAGRYASALESFRGAIALGEELGDRLLTSFDHAYLGECHLERGEYRMAEAAFLRAEAAIPGGEGGDARLRDWIRSRRAAMPNQRKTPGDELDSLLAKFEERVEYLEAWNLLYLAVAFRQRKNEESAARALTLARDFFGHSGVLFGEARARIELAELDLDRGRAKSARSVLDRMQAGSFERVWSEHALLCARYHAARARLELSSPEVELPAAYSSLVEAEGSLLGRRSAEIESRVAQIRRRVEVARLGTSLASCPRPAGRVSLDDSELSDALGKSRELLDRILESKGSVPEDLLREIERHRDRIASREAGSRSVVEEMVGKSREIRKLKALIQQLAPADVSVLILGETGTGKELAARHIHDASTRPGAIQIIDCSALPSELVASELFGYRSGAFSGAEKDHDGILVQAAGGTLLIDEIGEASLDLQGKLLRVLDRRTVRPLGAEEEQTIDARLLFTTNSDLESRVSEGSFRRDLYYRIAACTVEVPPLRERLEDLPLLIEHFLSRLGSDETGLEISNGAMRLLSEYPWPGNVRELDNVITRLGLQGLESADVDEVRMLLGEHNVSRCFSPALLRSRPLVELSRQLEFEYMVELYRATSGDLELLGQRLGISRQAVYKRLKAIGANPSALRRAVAGEAVELEKPNGRA